MTNLFDSVNGELIFIYGLIAIVIILIIVIIVIDRIESKKKQKSLSDTLTLKPIMDDIDTSLEDEQIEVIDMIDEDEEDSMILDDIDTIPEVDTKMSEDIYVDSEYIESDLEKTQAQIRVEEITKALEEALEEEKEQEKDRFSKFEEEQEKSAIISYDELKESFDELYEQNEKTQYLDDDQIPINIDELYELNEKVDMPIEKEEKNIETKIDDNVNFKSSPYISPVYGIQNNKDEDIEVLDVDIENANDFLTNLKELRENLK